MDWAQQAKKGEGDRDEEDYIFNFTLHRLYPSQNILTWLSKQFNVTSLIAL